MAICPHCQATAEAPLQPCPNGDGYYFVEEDDLVANRGNDLLGRAIGGRFVVVGTLGKGSMAQVYRAHQIEVDRTIALKVFRAVDIGLGSDNGASLAESRDRFAQEARVLAKLAHPNCVTLYDFGADETCQLLYIAMEHVAGVSLRTAINRGLRLAVILAIVDQVLLALSEAHALGIVHRDLKPENIILSFRHSAEVPIVKVVDFGIAKLLGHDRVGDKTRVGALFGTPAYMSPEQCRGDVDAVGAHSDVYALGCLLFEMVTGHLPYPSDQPMQMIRLHTDAPVPPIVPRPSLDVPKGLASFITRCLQKDPALRYADAPAMHAAFDAVRGVVAAPGRFTRNAAHRVVVPGNQLSGAQIDPPPTFQTAVPGTAGAQPPRATPREPREADVDPTRGIEQSRLPLTSSNSSGRFVVFLAFTLVTLACVVLFWFIWQMLAG